MIITECTNTKCNAPIHIGWEIGNGYGYARHECQKCGVVSYVELTGLDGVTLDEKSFHEKFPAGQHGKDVAPKKIGSKKSYKALANRWEKDLSTTKWIQDNKKTFFKLLYWAIFKRYRIIYFMELCQNGMAHDIAWRDANKRDAADVFNWLKLWGWSW